MIDPFTSNAYTSAIAYLDGGTGSMLLQAALAGILTAGYFLKTQWTLVKSVFRRRSK